MIIAVSRFGRDQLLFEVRLIPIIRVCRVHSSVSFVASVLLRSVGLAERRVVTTDLLPALRLIVNLLS